MRRCPFLNRFRQEPERKRVADHHPRDSVLARVFEANEIIDLGCAGDIHAVTVAFGIASEQGRVGYRAHAFLHVYCLEQVVFVFRELGDHAGGEGRARSDTTLHCDGGVAAARMMRRLLGHQTPSGAIARQAHRHGLAAGRLMGLLIAQDDVFNDDVLQRLHRIACTGIFYGEAHGVGITATRHADAGATPGGICRKANTVGHDVGPHLGYLADHGVAVHEGIQCEATAIARGHRPQLEPHEAVLHQSGSDRSRLEGQPAPKHDIHTHVVGIDGAFVTVADNPRIRRTHHRRTGAHVYLHGRTGHGFVDGEVESERVVGLGHLHIVKGVDAGTPVGVFGYEHQIVLPHIEAHGVAAVGIRGSVHAAVAADGFQDPSVEPGLATVEGTVLVFVKEHLADEVIGLDASLQVGLDERHVVDEHGGQRVHAGNGHASISRKCKVGAFVPVGVAPDVFVPQQLAIGIGAEQVNVGVEGVDFTRAGHDIAAIVELADGTAHFGQAGTVSLHPLFVAVGIGLEQEGIAVVAPQTGDDEAAVGGWCQAECFLALGRRADHVVVDERALGIEQQHPRVGAGVAGLVADARNGIAAIVHHHVVGHFIVVAAVHLVPLEVALGIRFHEVDIVLPGAKAVAAPGEQVPSIGGLRHGKCLVGACPAKLAAPQYVAAIVHLQHVHVGRLTGACGDVAYYDVAAIGRGNEVKSVFYPAFIHHFHPYHLAIHVGTDEVYVEVVVVAERFAVTCNEESVIARLNDGLAIVFGRPAVVQLPSTLSLHRQAQAHEGNHADQAEGGKPGDCIRSFHDGQAG